MGEAGMPVDNEIYKVEGGRWWGEEQPFHFLATGFVPARLAYLRRTFAALAFDPAGRRVVDIGYEGRAVRRGARPPRYGGGGRRPGRCVPGDRAGARRAVGVCRSTTAAAPVST